VTTPVCPLLVLRPTIYDVRVSLLSSKGGYPLENEAGNPNVEASQNLARLQDTMSALRSMPTPRAISAMPVVVQYKAVLGKVQLVKGPKHHYFEYSRTLEDGSIGEQWVEEWRNPFEIRDEFQKVETQSEALDFLAETGIFSPLCDIITWTEFKQWQRFAFLVREHEELAAAMRTRQLSGEHAEVLKALTGHYASSFFEIKTEPELTQNLDVIRQVDPNFERRLKDGEARAESRRRVLFGWFRQPPDAACSVRWVPKDNRLDPSLARELQRGGAMFEFLKSQDTLRPMLLITAHSTLQAIAAAIFVDRVQGVQYRKCSVCSSLFELKAHKNKKYCDRTRCKNIANQKRMRENRSKKLRQAKA
jgi:hypothetical protein